MTEVAKQTNLVRRGAVYYYRARVPQDIASFYGKKEECTSLGTKDHVTAVKLAKIKAVELEEKYEVCRLKLRTQSIPLSERVTPDYLDVVRKEVYRRMLSDDDLIRVIGVPSPAKNGDVILYKEHAKNTQVALVSGLEHSKKSYALGDVSAYIERALEWVDATEEQRGAPEILMVARAIQEAFIEAKEDILKRGDGQVVKTPQEKLSVTPSITLEPSSMPLLSNLMEEWIKDKSRSDWRGDKTPRDHRVAVESFISLNGDMPSGDYTKAHARAFRGLLLTLPPNWKKLKALKGLSIEQAAEKAAALGLSPMSEKTASNNFGFVKSFWIWLQAHYDLDRNVFENLAIKVHSNKRDERLPFTDVELSIIFTSPVYSGCLSKEEPFKAGNCSMAGTAEYWVPLISLYSGMRLGEILQLHINDVKQEDGIWYFDINGNAQDKQVKTAKSNRLIPIHHALLGIGIITFISEAKASGRVRLFPDGTKGAFRNYTDTFSNYFRRFLIVLGVKHEKNAFHSFRHNFEDGCRNSGVPREVMEALQGHVGQNMTGRYGSGYNLSVLNEELQKVAYDGLKLGHLKKKKATDTKTHK